MSLFGQCSPLRAGLWASAVLLLGALALGIRGKGSPLARPSDDLEQARMRGEQMEGACRAIALRLECKERVTDALLDGRLGLLEAAAFFQLLNRRPPAVPEEDLRMYLAGDSDEERLCHCVIAFAECKLRASRPGRPERACQVRQRLLDELYEHLRRGPIRLPAVDADSPFVLRHHFR